MIALSDAASLLHGQFKMADWYSPESTLSADTSHHHMPSLRNLSVFGSVPAMSIETDIAAPLAGNVRRRCLIRHIRQPNEPTPAKLIYEKMLLQCGSPWMSLVYCASKQEEKKTGSGRLYRMYTATPHHFSGSFLTPSLAGQYLLTQHLSEDVFL